MKKETYILIIGIIIVLGITYSGYLNIIRGPTYSTEPCLPLPPYMVNLEGEMDLPPELRRSVMSCDSNIFGVKYIATNTDPTWADIPTSYYDKDGDHIVTCAGNSIDFPKKCYLLQRIDFDCEMIYEAHKP
jgi:hypothetical protein